MDLKRRRRVGPAEVDAATARLRNLSKPGESIWDWNDHTCGCPAWHEIGRDGRAAAAAKHPISVEPNGHSWAPRRPALAREDIHQPQPTGTLAVGWAPYDLAARRSQGAVRNDRTTARSQSSGCSRTSADLPGLTAQCSIQAGKRSGLWGPSGSPG